MRKKCLEMVYKLAKKNKKVIFIGSDLGAGVLSNLQKELPNQFFMEGISEQYITGMTVGLSKIGFIPYFNTIATFITRRNFEQNFIGLGLHNSNVRLIGNGGGFVYAPLGPTHLAIEDISIMNSIPNMSIICPSDANEMENLMRETLKWKGPIYIRLAKGGDEIISKDIKNFRIGKAITYSKTGSVLLIGTGITTKFAIDAKKQLKKELDCGVIHFNTISPFDEKAILEYIKNNDTKLIITIEEHILSGGLSSLVSAIILKKDLNIKFRSIGIPNKKFIEKYGSQSELLNHYLINTKGIIKKIKENI
ncbi:hypothetical protein OA182_02080 [Candidatus Pelagibacter sp.]|nr:hypothetical protein [Candidatus Pelagibacter sp.]